MKDPKLIRVPRRTYEAIEARVEGLRLQFPRWTSSAPIDVERLIEIGFKVQFQFESGLNTRVGIDALLLNTNPVSIAIDEDQWNSDDQHRVRFSLAHELAHLLLHKTVFADISFRDSNEWLDFMLHVPADKHLWLERHANYFAECLLVPAKLLKNKFASYAEHMEPGEQPTVRKLSRYFRVSDECMRIRLGRLGLITQE